MKLIILPLVCLLVACTQDNKLQRALRYAGDNREELENVLKHYSQTNEDSLKLRAAICLIETLPEYYSITERMTNGYFQKVEEMYPNMNPARKIALFSLPQFYMSTIRGAEYDIHNITSEFLIEHIDYLFDVCSDRLTNKDIAFDTFTQYILPYKISNEPLSYLMRNNYYLDTRPIHQYKEFDLMYPQWKKGMSLWYSRIANDTIYSFNLPYPVSDIVLYGDCILSAFYEKKRNNLLGIPSAVFFTPHFHNKNGRHYWTAQIHDEDNIQMDIEDIEDASKVYMISCDHGVKPLDKGDEFIPLEFIFYNLKDCTRFAFDVSDVKIVLGKLSPKKPRYAYLSVFNEMAWQPVAWAENINQRATFKDMAKCALYQTIYYDNQKMYISGYPFFLQQNGRKYPFIPNLNNLQKITIRRKYPFTGLKATRILDIENLYVLLACDKDFVKADTLPKLEYNSNKPYYEIVVPGHITFNYLRLEQKNVNFYSYSGVSEVHVYDQEGNKISPQPVNQETSILFDDNLLTFQDFIGSLTIEFEESVSAARIQIYPRTDENEIYPGNIYELFYADIDGWKSLGVQIADDYYIEYENVPSEALLWLHNHTRGREERPFVYRNGTVIFF